MITKIVQSVEEARSVRDSRGISVLIEGALTDGRLAVVACELAAGVAGPPMHIHPRSDETFIIHSGSLLVLVGDELVSVGAGGLVYVPRGIPHTFATSPAEGSRFHSLHSPSGFEMFHLEVARTEQLRGCPLQPTDILRIAPNHDCQLVGPPLLPTGQLAGPAV